MYNLVKILADKLDNKTIRFKPDSIYDLSSLGKSNVDVVCKALAEKTIRDVELVKNRILPQAIKATEDFEKIVSNLKYNKPLLKDYKVIEYETPEIINVMLQNGTIPNEVSRDGTPLPEAMFTIPKPENISMWLKLENSVEQKLLDDILNTYDNKEMILVDLWNQYFDTVSITNHKLTTLNIESFLNMDKVIIILAIANVLKLNPVSNIRVTATKLNQTLDTIINLCVNSIFKNIKTLEDRETLNMLVLDVKDNTICVSSKVYDQFLDKFSVEVLLGLHVKGLTKKPLPLTLSGISEIQGECLTAWKNEEKKDKYVKDNMKIDSYKKAYDNVIYNVIRGVGGELKEHSINLSQYSSNMVYEYLNTLTMNQLVDYKTIIVELVGAIAFPTTLTLDLTEKIKEQKLRDKTLTMEEAATLAVLELVVEYLMSQIEVV